LRPDECAVLTVGSLTRQKAYHRLIEAFAAVAARHAEAVLLIAGDGPLKNDLVRQAREAGHADRVRWLGPRADVADLMCAADLFTLSSEREGLSLALLEAMRGERPVVATRVGGNAEAVAEGETGLIVPPHDPAALAQALSSLVADSARRVAFGHAARARWQRLFTAERMVRDTEALYREALSRRGHPAGRPAAEVRGAHAAS
jgi:glycosyltransferase involved in cell wall biosynthesis